MFNTYYKRNVGSWGSPVVTWDVLRFLYMWPIPNRQWVSLWPLISHPIFPRFRVNTDCYGEYRRLGRDHGFRHCYCIHYRYFDVKSWPPGERSLCVLRSFVNPMTGEHINNIERCWGHDKRGWRKYRSGSVKSQKMLRNLIYNFQYRYNAKYHKTPKEVREDILNLLRWGYFSNV